MPVLQDPVITLEDVRVRALSLASLDLLVKIRVENPNPLGITLRELPFTVTGSSGTGAPAGAVGGRAATSGAAARRGIR